MAPPAHTLSEVVEKLPAPRIVWIMLPAGTAVEDHLVQLKEILSPGDIMIDGGNTYFKDDIRRAESLSEKEISFLDVGVSGGIWGLELGYCLMIGGTRAAYEKLEPLFKEDNLTSVSMGQCFSNL